MDGDRIIIEVGLPQRLDLVAKLLLVCAEMDADSSIDTGPTFDSLNMDRASYVSVQPKEDR